MSGVFSFIFLSRHDFAELKAETNFMDSLSLHTHTYMHTYIHTYKTRANTKKNYTKSEAKKFIWKLKVKNKVGRLILSSFKLTTNVQ